MWGGGEARSTERSRVTAGGGKGPEFKVNVRRGKSQEIGVSLQPPQGSEASGGVACQSEGIDPLSASTRCTTRCTEGMFWLMPWRLTKANGGAAGGGRPDASRTSTTYGVERWLDELAEDLRKKTYRPRAVRRVYIPKPDGRKRPLGIPTIRDRVAQMAAVLVLAPIFEADLEPEQYAYRPGRSAHDAVRHVHRLLNTGRRDVVDADLSGYFDNIPHSELLTSLARRISDRHMLRLIKQWLVASVEEEDGRGGRRQTATARHRQGRHPPRGADLAAIEQRLHAAVRAGLEDAGTCSTS